RNLCVFIVTIFVAGVAHGAGFDNSSVPSDVQWIAHIDVDVYRLTDVAGMLSSIRPEKHRHGLAFLKQQLGLDPAEDINSVTLYGSNLGRKDAVAVVKGNLDSELIIRALEKNGSYHAVGRGGYMLHKWDDPRRGSPCVACFIAGDTVVLAGSETEALEFAEVNKGKRESLADAGAQGLRVPDAEVGRFFVASVNGPLERLNGSAHAKVFRNAKAMSMAMGEIDGQLQAELNVIAEDSEAASQVEIVFMGLRAAALLNRERKPGLANLAENAIITTDGDKVRILLASRPEELRVLFSGR
ncbi:MAG: hypothetical protein ACOC6C_06015, partial [Verrucomicrobiota bacterium]